MDKMYTGQDFQTINVDVIESDSNSISKDGSNRSKDSSNCSNPVISFPCSKLECSKHLPISDVTVGKWLKILTDANVRNVGNMVSHTDFHHLTEMVKRKENGQSPLDYVTLISDDLFQEIDKPGQDTNGYALVVNEQKNAIEINSAKLDLQHSEAMQALMIIANAKKQENELKEKRQENLRKQWDVEILSNLADEIDYKAKRENELRQQLGL